MIIRTDALDLGGIPDAATSGWTAAYSNHGSTLLVFVGRGSNNATTTVTFNGVSLQPVGDASGFLITFVLRNAPLITADIVIETGENNYAWAVAGSYLGVHQVFDNTSQQNFVDTTPYSLQFATIKNNCWGVACINGPIPHSSGGQYPEVVRSSTFDTGFLSDTNGPISPAANTTFSGTLDVAGGVEVSFVSLAPASVTYINAGTTQFAAPGDWPGTADYIALIGAGGNGAARSSTTRGGPGGGGGAFVGYPGPYTLANAAACVVGAGGSQTDTSLLAGTFLAKAGTNATTTVIGAGGAAASCVVPAGGAAFSGGSGLRPPSTAGAFGGGGGGAAGPLGAGLTPTTNVGGSADNGRLAASGTAGTAGLAGTEFDATHGSGTGGTGNTSGDTPGTVGGNYGGGASGHAAGGVTGSNGVGAPGLIAVFYTPTGTILAQGVAQGTATAGAVARPLASARGSAAGTGTAAAFITPTGSSSGLGTAIARPGIGIKAAAAGISGGTAPSISQFRAAGTSAGTGSAVAGTISAAVSAGQGAAAAVGQSQFLAVGTSAGAGSANAVRISSGSSVGTGAAAAPSISQFLAVGSAAGAGSATGAIISFGISAGAGTAAAAGQSQFRAAGNAAGAAVALGRATGSAVGNAAGQAAAQATGAAQVRATGSAAGVGAVLVVVLQPSSGAASGLSTASAVGRSQVRSVGQAAAVGAATGLSIAGAVSRAGNAVGQATASAVGRSQVRATGTATVFGTGLGVGIPYYAGRPPADIGAVAQPPAGHLVAVEIDLFNEQSGDVEILRLCNFGPLFSSARPDVNFIPSLSDPAINLGTSISLPTYGQPMRALGNTGRFSFVLDATAYAYLGPSYHWIGVKFRVYEGELKPGGYREDLPLIYEGRVTNLSHDTKTVTAQTGDASVDLDQPLVSQLYPEVTPGGPNNAAENIGNTPLPKVWGVVMCIQPVLIDSANIIFDVSSAGLVAVDDVRVGGVSWPPSSSPVAADPGTYLADLVNGRITLGSDPLGGEVRVDARGPPVNGVGDLIRKIVADFGILADDETVNRLDTDLNLSVGYYQNNTSTNVLNVLDDIATGAGCYWGISALGKLIVGKIEAPAVAPTVPTKASYENILSLELTQALPPAWRVRLEYERHWQPEAQFYDAVAPEDQQRWRAPGRTIVRQDETIKRLEPRAFDVPTLRSIATLLVNANAVVDTLWDAWNERRSIYNVSLWVDPSEVSLYSTIAVDYQMVRGNYRILSAVRSIGGGPCTVQLWG